ncbi:MAG: GH25 family lysozyme [Pseudomonadota bacterium]
MAARTPALLIKQIISTLAMLTIIAVLLWIFAARWAPSRATYPLQGIDVSASQGEIDWRKLRAGGADFAYIKASEGADIRDTQFAENWQATREAGLRRGAIHTFTLCHLARDQATNLIATVPREPNMLPAVLSLEFMSNCTARPDQKVLLNEIALFIEMVEAHTGKAMIIYTTKDFEDAYQVSSAINRSLWLRRMFLKPSYGSHPWVIWQANNQRRIDGITGPVNWNVLQP